ncbi:MAG: T9SS type A sorting domain-containing protein [Chlorobi bacterium]|nr:T9SS type A sorting domain-containing protein [Chlorobiota bacterium]
MKKSIILLGVAILFLSVFSFLHFIELSNNQLSKTGEKPNEWFFMQRAFPYGEINHEAYVSSQKVAQELKTQKKKEKEAGLWELAGPLNIGGRITDVAMPENDLQTIYIGAANGGIFKSVDAGNNWDAVFDEALSLSIGDIAIAPSNPEIIYVGTGEANAGGGSLAYDGVGVYKSGDGGDTWEFAGLEGSRNIGRMVVHPTNPDILYVAAMGNLFANSPERGVFKTTDGGQNWQNVLFVSDSTGAIDIVIHPENPEILYAAMWERVRRPDRRSYGGPTCGIYKTTNGGSSWTELSTGLPSPSSDVGRIGIDISKSQPNVLYAIYADKTGYFDGIYKTTNDGGSWIQTNDGTLDNAYQSYGWWFGRISIDPTNSEVAYVIAFDTYKTSNGGNSYSNITQGDTHVDQHSLFSHPLNPSFLVLGNDGGLYISQNGGNSWTWKNNLPITQFYTCETDHQFPDRLYGGAQDNGTNRTMTGSPDDWESIYWGDGFYVLVDPENNNYVYAEYQYGNLARSTNGGNSFSSAMNGISSSDRKNWNTPVVFDPSNPSVLYYGSQRIYKSTNKAGSWSSISPDLTNGEGAGNLTYGTITTLAVSPLNPGLLYAGTDDGNVWVKDGNTSNWEFIASELPVRWVTRVAADPFDENTAYASFSGYRYDEFLPHIFRTTDKGQSWEDISGDLPEAPINDIIPDPEQDSTLYIATDVGVFVTRNDGESWELTGSNLPLAPVMDLKLHNPTRKLIAATYGRSMFAYDLFQDTILTSIPNPKLEISTMDIVLFPNPFSEKVQIKFDLRRGRNGEILIYNSEGKNVKVVFSGMFQKGENKFGWQSQNLPDGVYFVQIGIGEQIISKKIVCKN